MSIRLRFEVDITVLVPSATDVLRPSIEESAILQNLILSSVGYPKADVLIVEAKLLDKKVLSNEENILSGC